MKSYLALYFGILVGHGAAQNGLAAVRGPVLYLDWELNAETVGGRLKALWAGHPELCQSVPYYQRCEAPLHEEVGEIAEYVAEHGVQFMILDSVAMACGGDLNKPETAIKLPRTLRQIGCSSLLLAHISKLTPEGNERSACGSDFFRELARNVWELERGESDGPTRVILTHKKNNFGPYHAPGLRVQVCGRGCAGVQVRPRRHAVAGREAEPREPHPPVPGLGRHAKDEQTDRRGIGREP